MEDVELVPAEDSEELLDLLARIEAPRHIQVAAAPAHGGLVFDPAGKRKTEGPRLEPCAALDLPQRHQTVEQARRRTAGNDRALRREFDRISLGREVGVDVAVDSVPILLLVAHDALAGEEELRQRGEIVCDLLGRLVFAAQ